MAVQLVDANTVSRAASADEPLNGATLPAVSPPADTTQSADIPVVDVPDAFESGHPVWRIPCGDMINRERAVTVFVDHDEVVVVGPPGESARLVGSQLNELRTALDEAAKLAER